MNFREFHKKADDLMSFHDFISTLRSGDFNKSLAAFYILGLQEAAAGADCRIGIDACRAYLLCLGFTAVQVKELLDEYLAGLADGAMG